MVRGKVILKVAALLAVAMLSVSAAQFIWTYLTAPEIVRQFERSANLSLDPANFAPTRRDWLLAVDDPMFYHHHGIDSRTRGAGYTTITQGLVKTLYFGHFRPAYFIGARPSKRSLLWRSMPACQRKNSFAFS